MDSHVPTIVKVSSPADILGVLPYRLGFHPTESIVVVCLQGPRRRDVLVMRFDLQPPSQDEGVAEELVDRAMTVDPSAVVVACYTEAAEGEDERLPREMLVDTIGERFKDRGVEVFDALLVRDGRWWSYRCSDSDCCPAAGSRLSTETTAAARSYAAESIALGDVLLRDRSELARTVRPVDGLAGAALREQAVETAAQALAEAVERGGVGGLRLLVMETFRSLLLRWAEGDGQLELPPVDAAVILLGLRDKRARDEVMTLVLDGQPEVLLALLVALAATADDRDAAPICTVLAWVAHAQGDGALANVAIERALDADPGYELARLIETGLDAMVSPAQVRRVAAQVRDDLRTGHVPTRAAPARARRRRKRR